VLHVRLILSFIYNFIIIIFKSYAYEILISNLHTARKPNELARVTNEPS
jgi:hypothetical protein